MPQRYNAVPIATYTAKHTACGPLFTEALDKLLDCLVAHKLVFDPIGIRLERKVCLDKLLDHFDRRRPREICVRIGKCDESIQSAKEGIHFL